MDALLSTWVDTVCELSEKDLNHMADWMEKQAALMRERAMRIAAQKKKEDDADALISYLKGTPYTVIKQLKKGVSLDVALKETAQITDSPVPTIEYYWVKFCNDTAIAARTARNNLIMHLAALGHGNADIGLKVGLHPGSVSRILGKEKRARIPLSRKAEIFQTFHA